MKEYYDLLWKNEDKEKVIGELIYDLEAKKFHAILNEGEEEFPTLLFGIFAQGNRADDRKVREYIDSCVISKNVPDLKSALEWMGFDKYDQWEIYKYNKGRNSHDLAQIRFRECK